MNMFSTGSTLKIALCVGTTFIILGVLSHSSSYSLQIRSNNGNNTVKSINFPRDSTQKRPIPYPVIPSPQFKQSISNGIRTTTGKPGPKYWTNHADYNLEASLSPQDQILRGEGTITYHNGSPDTLRKLVVHLRQNFYREGGIRNRSVRITGGMELSQIKVDGQSLLDQSASGKAGYRIQGTLLYINPAQPLPPGQEINLQFAWNFKIPPAYGSRMGQDGEVFYLGYWYPQMAVYDDVKGWYAQPYMGDGEFYMGYGDYQVDITVPEGYLVGATGKAINYEKVLTPKTLQRLKQARSSGDVVNVVSKNQRKAGQSTRKSKNGHLTWKFRAHNVRDFAFGASDDYVWDATRAQTQSNDYALIHSFYRPEHKTWQNGATYTRFAIEHLSKQLGTYPWPHMTVMEGILGGGMEYPMITIIGHGESKKGLFGTVYHETAHMWFPMMVGSNEKRYTWMDEGLVTYLTHEGKAAYWPDEKAWVAGESGYYSIAGSGNEVPPMRHGDRYPVYGSARGIASYSKPGLMLHTLRGIVGKQAFNRAFRKYVDRWSYKHPYPHDLFNTFEEVAHRDLDWFWTSTLYNTWTLDQAIAKVRPQSSPIPIRIHDKGLMPMPVTVACTYQDGSTETKEIPVTVWLKGKRKTTVECSSGNLRRVELDPKHYLPDLDRSNNVWTGN